MLSTAETRFHEFKRRLCELTGDKAVLYRGVNSVAIEANEFSPRRAFRSIQEAIDHFAYLLPPDFVNPPSNR